jgi:glutaredoxin/uncharacterized protein (DUF302 family)
MNITHARKTDKSVAEVVARFKEGLEREKITLVGEKEIANGKSSLIYFLNPEWTERIMETDPMLTGLVPNVAFVKKDGEKTMVGIVNPQILMGGGHTDELAPVIEEMDSVLRKIVQMAADVEDPKVEKVKLYSTATCPYCRMEKDYLDKHGIVFELVMVDEDRKVAEEMVRKSGQTGVPQTEVFFSDGDSEIVMGFDKGRLNELLKIERPNQRVL